MPQNEVKPVVGAIPKQTELEILIRARYPLVYVVSWEEQRVAEEVRRIAGKLNKKVCKRSLNFSSLK
jgi:hypothetical protein